MTGLQLQRGGTSRETRKLQRGRTPPGWALTVIALAAATMALPALAAALAGDLDPSFGNVGKVQTDFGANDRASSVAIQSDGKIVVAGDTGLGISTDFAIVRYNADGSLDATFGNGGKVTSDLGDFDKALAIAIQSDGKVVVAGHTGFADFALARYNADGGLDSSFGAGGMVTTDFGGFDQARAIGLQGDGKIVVAGNGGMNAFGLNSFALARYSSDGSLDPTFDQDGLLIAPFAVNDGASALAIQPDGKIVAAGFAQEFGPSIDFALARFEADGTLDPNFDADGKVTTDFGGFDSASDLAIQSDGKLVAAGRETSVFGVSDFALARYNADGSLDTSFDADGQVTTDFIGDLDEAYGVAVQTDGKIVAAGITVLSVGGDAFGLARYNADGSLDANFGVGGKVTTDFSDGTDDLFDVALQADGKIVGVGITLAGVDFAVARYLGDPTVTEVVIEVGPGTANPIKLSRGGLISIAILTTDTFDATAVDPSTVCFGDDADPSQRDCTEAHNRGHLADVDADGDKDMLLHFDIAQTGIDAGDTSACLSGSTFPGDPIEGCGAIRVLAANCVPPPPGLVGWWPGDGNALDIVGGLDATQQGDAAFGAGIVGQAFSLDGDGDFIDVPHDPTLGVGTGDLTIDLWVRFNTTEGEQILVEKYVQRFESPSSGWTFTKLEGNEVGFFAEGLGAASDPLSLQSNTWIHFAARRHDNTVEIFMNGILIASNSAPGPWVDLDSASSLKFGHRGNPADTPGSEDDREFYLNGQIDEVELFDRALTDSQIRAIVAASSSGKCS